MPRALIPCTPCILGNHAAHETPRNWWHLFWATVLCPCQGECAESDFAWWLREQQFDQPERRET